MRAIFKYIGKKFLILLFIPAIGAYGQTQGTESIGFTIPQIALVDVEPSGSSSITFTLTIDPESGLPVSASDAINNNLWINYSSCFPTGGNNRRVTVQVASGAIPPGVTLTLLASAFSGSGSGTRGTSAGSVNLTGTPETIISGIGRCYTGDGQNNGHRLNYSLSISDYSALKFNQSATIQIAFTLTDM
jgi:hypothetical protein